MPTDNRRLPVPEGTRSPQVFTKQKQKFITNEKRKDGRSSNGIRPIFIRTGIVSAAKGSAYMEINKTKVLCSVFGPRETTKRQDFSVNGKLVCEFKFAPFSCILRRQHQLDTEEKEYSTILKEALEPVVCLYKFPKSTIDIFVLVIENDGSSLSAAITCAGAALADSGIDMYDIVVGASLKRTGNFIFVDPTLDEENSLIANKSDSEEEGSLTIAWMPSLQQVAAVLQSGTFKSTTVVKGLETLIETCKLTKTVIENCLLNSVKNVLEKDEEQSENNEIMDNS